MLLEKVVFVMVLLFSNMTLIYWGSLILFIWGVVLGHYVLELEGRVRLRLLQRLILCLERSGVVVDGIVLFVWSPDSRVYGFKPWYPIRSIRSVDGLG